MHRCPDQIAPSWPEGSHPVSAQAGRGASLLSVTLQCGPDGVEVQSVEFHSGEVITRCAFMAHRHPAEVLAPDMAEVVMALALEAGEQIGIISKPEFSLALPGIALNRLRIMVSRARDAMRYVNLRFLECFGNVATIFAPQTRPWRMGHDQSAQVAADTLETVFMPLRNFAAYLDAEPGALGPEGPVAEALRATRRKIEELEVYHQMLGDFLAAQDGGPDRTTARAVARLVAGT